MSERRTVGTRVYHFVAWTLLVSMSAMILCQVIIWLER